MVAVALGPPSEGDAEIVETYAAAVEADDNVAPVPLETIGIEALLAA